MRLPLAAMLVASFVIVPLEAEARPQAKQERGERVKRSAVATVKVVHRREVRLHRDFPVRRVRVPVYVRRPLVVVRIAPRVFLPPLLWPRLVVPLVRPDQLVWQDKERMQPDDGWAETQFDVNRAGRSLSIEVHGALDGDFAEIVFKNGETQVVDFNAGRMDEGHYSLIDLPGGVRHVDHVRFVGRAESAQASVTLRLLR